MSRRLSLVFFSIVAFILAACGGGAAGGGGGATTLDQTYNADGISFKYPSGWVAEGVEGQVLLANSQDTMTRAQAATSDAPTLNAGDRAMTFLVFDAETISAMGATTPLGLLQTIGQSSGDAIGMTLGEPAETTIGGKPAARITGSNDTLETQYLVVDLGASGYVVVVGLAPKGEIGSLESTLNAVAETVAVEPVAVG